MIAQTSHSKSARLKKSNSAKIGGSPKYILWGEHQKNIVRFLSFSSRQNIAVRDADQMNLNILGVVVRQKYIFRSEYFLFRALATVRAGSHGCLIRGLG